MTATADAYSCYRCGHSAATWEELERHRRAAHPHKREHRTPHPPYEFAPDGTCRLCGEPVPKSRRRWCSGECVYRWRLVSNASTMRAFVHKRDSGRCVDCPPGTPPLPFRPQIRRELRVPYEPWEAPIPEHWHRSGYVPTHHTVPLVGPIDDRTWEADHVVELIDGGSHEPENVVIRCTSHHKAKTIRERRRRLRAQRRAARRASR